MKKIVTLIFGLTLAATLGACGQKGALILPPQEPAQQEQAKTDEASATESNQ